MLEDNLSIIEAEERLSDIKRIANHPRWLVRIGIGLACSSLCILAGGDNIDGLITFVAATTGLIIRQVIVSRQFNSMIAILLAAFVTTLI